MTKLTDKFSVFFFLAKVSTINTLFNNELHFSINVDGLSTHPTKADY
jgi:hypothetical protein